jgi:PadR family transcriptional regulator PadR
MERPPVAGASPPLSRFDLAPPRHFLFPAVLLLLADEPGYGYRLVKELEGFRFGAADRPSVYRTLAQLERDGLVVSWSDECSSAQSRRLYRLTPAGERALRVWMGVIKEERDRLDAVLRRYAASGGIDAALAEVEGGWGALSGSPLSSVAPVTASLNRTARVPPRAPGGELVAPDTPSYRARFEIVPARSAVLVEARSTVGPLTFGAMGLAGAIEAVVRDGRLSADATTTADVVVPADALRSGNEIYDAELRRRIDARRYPNVTLVLRECHRGGSPDQYRVSSDVTIHGVTRRLEGTLVMSQPGEGVVSVTGEQVVDIRDFDIASPTVLMLRIYPDVVVRLYLEAEEVAERDASESDSHETGSHERETEVRGA